MAKEKADKKPFQYAMRLSSRGLLHAAFEHLQGYLLTEHTAAKRPGGSYEWSLLQDEIGKIQVQWGQFSAAEQSFSRAATYRENRDHLAKCQIHLAMALREQGHFDRAYRLLSEFIAAPEGLSALRLGILYNNLASVQWETEFYRDAANSMLKSLELFHRADMDAYDATLYLNLGTCYLDMRQFDEAKKYLTLGLNQTGSELLYALFGLSRLYFTMGDYARSIEYAEQAVPLLGSIPMNFAKSGIAHVSRFLAEVAYRTGDRRLATALMEKAELFFGMLERWTLWSETQSLLLAWSEHNSAMVNFNGTSGLPGGAGSSGVDGGAGSSRRTGVSGVDGRAGVSSDGSLMMKRFLWIIDAMNAQELLSPKFAELIDTRVEYAMLLADSLHLNHEAKETLAYAARLADYGLTALDPEVIADPHRSPQAERQYKQHPRLSVEMLQDFDLPTAAYEAIACHHHRRDGSGFGAGLVRGAGWRDPVGETDLAAHPGETVHGAYGGEGDESKPFVYGGQDGHGGKSSAEPGQLISAILQLADEYATSVVWHGHTHSQTMSDLKAHASAYDKEVLCAMMDLFENP